MGAHKWMVAASARCMQGPCVLKDWKELPETQFL